jgi:hypothetical protein
MTICVHSEQTARARPRRKLFQPAELDMAGGRGRVHLLDLSESGAQLNAARPPLQGSFVSLSCGDLRRSARVAWVAGRRVGIAFLMPLTSREVEAVLALGDRKS